MPAQQTVKESRRATRSGPSGLRSRSTKLRASPHDRDWVVKFNAHGPDGLVDRQAPGHPGKLNTAQRAALAAMVASGPIPAIHGVVRWRLIDLAMWLWEEFRISVSKQR